MDCPARACMRANVGRGGMKTVRGRGTKWRGTTHSTEVQASDYEVLVVSSDMEAEREQGSEVTHGNDQNQPHEE